MGRQQSRQEPSVAISQYQRVTGAGQMLEGASCGSR